MVSGNNLTVQKHSDPCFKKSLIKMFPLNFQLSDDFCEVFGQKSRLCFSVALVKEKILQLGCVIAFTQK